ncbi:hypothetical protein ACFQ6B_25930 [Streptomyces wedmorensis]|uniref:Uncharacterized protein n=1 Tax=Streptomyces wedmorensis TaxID=43759 RepID=A0ABW6J956_STRWE
MEDVGAATRTGRTEEPRTGRIRTCRPAFRRPDADRSADPYGGEEDPEPQIVRGED